MIELEAKRIVISSKRWTRAPAISIFTSVNSKVFVLFDMIVRMDSVIKHFSHESSALRAVNDDDIQKLVSIINRAYSYQDKAKGGPRTDSEHLKARINETNFYVVTKKDSIVGCFYLEPRNTSLHFGLLTLTPETRGTGLGLAVIEAIISYASDNSYEFLELDYMSLAPWLKQYYEKYGFQETGDIVKWGTIDLIRMKKEL